MLFRVLKYIKSYWFSLVIFIVLFFVLGYFICDYGYNNLNAKYVYSFTSDADDLSYLLDSKYFEETIKTIDEYNKTSDKKISYAKIEYVDMLKTASLSNDDGIYYYSVRSSFFPSTVKQSSGVVNEGMARCSKYLSLMFSYAVDDIVFVDIKLVDYQNPFMVGLYSGLSGILILGFIIVFVSLKEKEIKDIADNDTIFKSCFHKKYWVLAKGFFSKVKNISTISILFALMMICKLIPIPSGFGSLGLGFTYLIFAVITMIYGPLCGLVIGMLSDILGFFMGSGGIFFFGYTLNSMLAGFTYGLCFYKTKVTFTKCLMARVIVNLVINVVLGSIWWKMIYNLSIDETLAYLILTSLPKNIIYLIPQSILLYVVLKSLGKVLARFGYIDDKIGDNISLF